MIIIIFIISGKVRTLLWSWAHSMTTDKEVRSSSVANLAKQKVGIEEKGFFFFLFFTSLAALIHFLSSLGLQIRICPQIACDRKCHGHLCCAKTIIWIMKWLMEQSEYRWCRLGCMLDWRIIMVQCVYMFKSSYSCTCYGGHYTFLESAYK